ncbi:MarR family winged helix-turn-helix transcriptional regulator [Pseudomonas typographi]|uniref:MarR family winged helix-turn-helix transcriptional regulator n=1 Tax=Pseudomonas typographi TaxID=2715964 RepID=UPI0016835408|nr:MarR family winged helix-turn-helix transcriptional regulator [Pseudomonas typographi]MBD1588667.1 winged helix-turn-helix transcriptional regulator [Pseudomonas typographi]
MVQKIMPGLGELLRFVSEKVERGADVHYGHMGLRYRARYTPVLRAIQSGADTVTAITASAHLTQGAISQTVSAMEADGLIRRVRLVDGRKSRIELTPHGLQLVETLTSHWAATFAVIEELEAEIGHPLRSVLVETASALERLDFSERLHQVKARRD